MSFSRDSVPARALLLASPQVTVRFDTILTTNNKLQEEIENLRIQKATLDNFYSKLHKHLAQQKRRMDTAIEQARQARKQRVECLARISAMNERHRQNTAQYNIEMEERERIHDQENKLKTFVLAKYTDRSEMEERAKKKEALKAAQRMKRSQGESFESREVTYRRLLELAEKGDINQLVDGFIEKEGKNFAYFSYATELNSEMEKLQQRIKNLQNEITLFTTDQENTENSSLHVLKELEEELSQNTEKANDYEDRCKESSKVLGQLKSAIEVLFKENNCDTTKIREQLGDKGQITDLNLMQYLGLVEKKTNELLLMESILLYTEADDSLTAQSFDNPLLGGTKLLRGMEQSHLCPPPPNLLGAIDATDACAQSVVQAVTQQFPHGVYERGRRDHALAVSLSAMSSWRPDGHGSHVARCVRGRPFCCAVEAPLDHTELRELLLSKYQKEQGSAARADKKGRNDIKA
uniref:Coiled-coil domain containing 63 n=1 Tax=Pavo cristatus TaxID=9049 RepID=A0A8C9FYE7_PAVCR